MEVLSIKRITRQKSTFHWLMREDGSKAGISVNEGYDFKWHGQVSCCMFTYFRDYKYFFYFSFMLPFVRWFYFNCFIHDKAFGINFKFYPKYKKSYKVSRFYER